MRVSEYLQLVGRHWIAVVLVFLLCVGAGAAYALNYHPQYQATAKAYVFTDSGVESSDLNQAVLYSEAVASSFAAAATTPAVLTSVGAALTTPMSSEALRRHVSASVEPGTVIIDVTATQPSPAIAAQTANAVISQLASVMSDLTVKGKNDTALVSLVTLQRAVPSADAATPGQVVVIGISVIAGVILAFVAAISLELVAGARANASTRSRRRLTGSE